MKPIAEQIIAILSATIGLAIVAVLVSKQSNTASVISGASSGFASIIGAAVAPVTGGGGGLNGFGGPRDHCYACQPERQHNGRYSGERQRLLERDRGRTVARHRE